MRLGLHIGYWGLGLTAEEQLELVQEAEPPATTPCGPPRPTARTRRRCSPGSRSADATIKLGSAIFQMPGRSPAMTAMTAATLDQLSDGRMLLGIGTSGPQVAEGWHGQRFGKQLQRTREYVEIVRKALARERLEYDGETLQLPLPDGPGKALKLTIAPVQERIPIYIAAIGPKNTSSPARSPTAGCRLLLPRARGRVPRRCSRRAARARAAARRSDDVRHRARRCNVVDRRRRRPRPRRDAPLRRPVRRRHGLARAELLQRAGAPLRVRGRRARGPGPLPRGQEGRGRRGAARRADRHGRARAARATACASGSTVYRDAGVGTLIVSPMAVRRRSGRRRIVARAGGDALTPSPPCGSCSPRSAIPDTRSR